MINLYNELKNFTPIDLENILKTNPDISEDFKTSIMLYNNALENLRTNSEDIAIIELKKAVAMNPDFHEAATLLGLCFYYMKAYEKAEEMFERVARAEHNGVMAFSYLNVIKEKDSSEHLKNEEIPKRNQSKRVSSKHNVTKSPVHKKKSILKNSDAGTSISNVSKEISDNNDGRNNIYRNSASEMNASERNIAKRARNSTSLPEFPLRINVKENKWDGMIKCVTGIIIGLIIAFIIGVPSIFSTNTDNKKDKENDATVIADLNGKIKEYEDKYNEQTIANDNLKKELENIKTDANYYKAAVKLFEVDNLVKNRKYEEAADILVSIKDVEFTSAEKDRFEKLLKDTMKSASDIVYSQAYNFFQSGKFKEALEKYEKIPNYMDDYGKMDIVLYYIGKAYLELNDSTNAKAAFEKVISRFPNSEYARYSQSRLNSIK